MDKAIDQTIKLIENHIDKKGYLCLKSTYQTIDGYPLGLMIKDIRNSYKHKKLDELYIRKLQSLNGWYWSYSTEIFETGLNFLKEYAINNGNTLVPVNYKNKQGFALGVWVSNLRRHSSKSNKRLSSALSKNQIDRIEAVIGWVWSVNHSKWEVQFKYLRDYIEKYGKLPKVSYKIDGCYVGRWVVNQRHSYNTNNRPISKSQIRKLESLSGWVWNIPDNIGSKYDEKIKKLENYIKNNEGNLPVNNYTTDDGKLGHWIATQKSLYRKGKLNKVKIKRLEMINGWNWKKSTERYDKFNYIFEKKFTILKNYMYSNTGQIPVQNYKTIDGVNIGWWVVQQRIKYRKNKLSSNRIAQLESLDGWSWNSKKKDAFESNFVALQNFMSNNNGKTPPLNYLTEDGKNLGRWVYKQRERYRTNKLSSIRIAQLQTLEGWGWKSNRRIRKVRHKKVKSLSRKITDAKLKNNPSTTWDFMYMLLVNFIQEYGHSIVKQHYKTKEGHGLGRWVIQQRTNFNTSNIELTNAQILKLEALNGWVWHTYNTAWEKAYNQLLIFVDKNGHTNIPKDYLIDGFKLGGWVFRQRYNYKTNFRKISDERISKLESIEGWVWKY